MHWADVLAKELHDRASKHVLATAITPSGPIHVGNMREVLTTEAVYRAVTDLGDDAELIYIGDTYDPLRKVYPFLDEATYKDEVGKPLSDIPCPGGCHANYAEHFLEPFLEDLAELGVQPKVLLAHEMYRGGQYVDAVKEALDESAKIRQIVIDVAKREGKIPPNWLPFNVQCANCARITTTVPDLYEYPFIEYHCKACGHQDKKDVRAPGGGKLPWRVDWPARWSFLEVTFEAMGKDHAAAGGSWDTGVQIAEQVFGYPPPLRTVYEFVQVKGVGAMHSSTGTAVSAHEMLKMTPPEVLRFLFMKNQPNRHIDFDTGKWIVDLVNDYDRWEEAFFMDDPDVRERAEFTELDRIYELSQPRELPADMPPHVPYNHLVLLAQISPDWDGILGILKRSGLVAENVSEEDQEHLRVRVEHARFWLENFAPDEVRTEIRREWDPALAEPLDPQQKRLLSALSKSLQNAPWTSETIHNTIHESAQAHNLGAAKGFGAVYQVVLGKKRGPRAGYLLASLEREFVLKRFEESSADV